MDVKNNNIMKIDEYFYDHIKNLRRRKSLLEKINNY